MPERSKRICFYDAEKLKLINDENLKLWQKYKIDMTLRDLSQTTIAAYENDLQQWFIYIFDNQFNQSVKELTEDDLTDFFYYCKMQGNNTNRMKRRMASISAFYKFLRKKKLIVENPAEFLDRPKHGLPITVQTFLSKEQVEQLRQKLKKYGNLQIQTYVMFSLSTMARGRSRGRYTRDDAHEDFMSEIEELMDKAPDEQTRRKFERFLAEMK